MPQKRPCPECLVLPDGRWWCDMNCGPCVPPAPIVTNCDNLTPEAAADLTKLAETLTGLMVTEGQVGRLRRAIDLAADAHFLQRDKAGQIYLWHPLRVGISLLPDVDAAIVGVLHDVLEDTQVTHAEMAAFLKDTELYQDVCAVTQAEGEPYLDYILRVARRPRAVKVKLADIRDNLDPARFATAVKVTDRHKMVTLHQKYLNAAWILNHIAN